MTNSPINVKEWLLQKESEFMSHVGDDIRDLAVHCETKKDKVTLSHYKRLRLNSYEQKLLHKYLADDALVWVIENAMQNSLARSGRWHVPVVYDEYLLGDGLSELLARFKELVKS